jgi:hypothetical protein
MLAYIFTGISALLGLVALCLAGYIFIPEFNSFSIGKLAVIFIVSSLCVAHPLLAIWLIKMDKLIWCYLYNALTLSIGLYFDFLLTLFVINGVAC